jgi:hypothetical protein
VSGSQVTELDSEQNQITDAGTAALAEALPGSQVMALDLGYNQVTCPWLCRCRMPSMPPASPGGSKPRQGACG